MALFHSISSNMKAIIGKGESGKWMKENNNI